MQRKRIIPVLTINGQGLVKTVKFRKPNYLGDPINAIKIFNDKEVDELVVLDISASVEGRKPDFKAIAEMASECFMPLAYGGGISDLEEIKTLFSIGIEKVILNSALPEKENLISEAAAIYGSQSIVVSLDVKKNLFGKYQAAYKNGQKSSKESPAELAKHYQQLGAGELLLHNIDKDGTFGGPDNVLIKEIAGALTIPVVACGGVASFTDILSCLQAGASAVAAGSFFVYRNNDTRSILISYPSQSELKEKIYSKLN